MIGICGIGGIGKSTIARAVYNSIADQFDSLCFLSKVREISNKHGLSHLQETSLHKLVEEKEISLDDDFHEGISIIEHRLQSKKILLLLDDVNKLEQLKALAGRCDWFGSGSRIIIMTRNKQLLKSHGVTRIYTVKKLALEVIGSNLCDKDVDKWSSALEEYERIPNKDVFEVLKLSYDALEEEHKEILLDLACFFNGEKLGDVKNMLKLGSLTHINFSKCKFLSQIPNLSGALNLKELRLDDCTSLIEIDDSVESLDNLKELSAM
ncbi:disease resistance protein Roq1-like [Prosopis cineraria]|uniref:disease resistance protein Roq1-like n=1 Tax=Prosopis cineraria TaxID=364024 RepID=UPI00240F110C|nr:disease resistance protein Roq1-like [Prosopis cineraria]